MYPSLAAWENWVQLVIGNGEDVKRKKWGQRERERAMYLFTLMPFLCIPNFCPHMHYPHAFTVSKHLSKTTWFLKAPKSSLYYFAYLMPCKRTDLFVCLWPKLLACLSVLLMNYQCHIKLLHNRIVVNIFRLTQRTSKPLCTNFVLYFILGHRPVKSPVTKIKVFKHYRNRSVCVSSSVPLPRSDPGEGVSHYRETRLFISGACNKLSSG